MKRTFSGLKHVLATGVLVAIVAGTAGYLSFRFSGDPAVEEALASEDALAWLRTDFKLTDAQFAVISRLHDAYSVECEEHCRQIQEVTRTRNALRSAPATDVAALAAAEQRLDALRQACETQIATHVRRCATEMSPDAGRRYLALVLPKIKAFDHEAAPDLKLSHGRH